MIKITKPLHDLRVLSVDQCESISDAAITQLVTSCPYIQELYLGSTHITDNSINLLATKLILLTHLHMPGCEYITEIGIKTLLRECKTLKHFDIKDCFNVVGDFDAIVSPAQQLLQEGQGGALPTEFRFLNANHRAFQVWNAARTARIDSGLVDGTTQEEDDGWEDVDDEEEDEEEQEEEVVNASGYMEFEV